MVADSAVLDLADVFLRHHWRMFTFRGQAEPFLWDARSQYLVRVHPSVLSTILHSENGAGTSLRTLLRGDWGAAE